MDYCEGGDLYNKIHSMRGVFVPEDQVSLVFFKNGKSLQIISILI
jgi:hypothetical protein